MRYLSLFSGIGGFELGIEQIMPEAQCVGYSEVDSKAVQVYDAHFQHRRLGDVTKINTGDLPDFDLLVGGFPCQAFSVAGKRKGFEDTRGTLFFDVARILRDKRPRYFILENVKGLLSHDSGKTLQTILEVLSDIGYTVEWSVLNTKNFGRPQNRERIYLVGYFGTRSGREVFPFEGIDGETSTQLEYIGAVDSIERWKEGKNLSRNFSEGQRVYDPKGISKTLNANGGGLGAKTGLYVVDHGELREVDTVTCLDHNYHKGPDNHGQRTMVRPVLTPNRVEKRQNGRRFKDDGEPSFTLTAQDQHGILIDQRIRKLTPLETERLQGFPDNWTENGTEGKISDTQRYKMTGNAVTVNVVAWVVSQLLRG